jgi:hypothetical protein
MKPHVSYSELKIWNECAFRHKLEYIDKLNPFTSSEHTAFGTAVHSVCENSLKDPNLNKYDHFTQEFDKEVAKLKIIDLKLVEQMREQAKPILDLFLSALTEYFGEFELVETEEDLFERFEEDVSFKGFIDLIIKDKQGKYHIIDWKTCGWGWEPKKKSDKIVTYQLTLYKWFWAAKHSIDLKDIETHFGLLKRTAKKDQVELFRVTSGEKKIQNALELLDKMVKNVRKEKFIKNRLSCDYCPFKKTEHCR